MRRARRPVYELQDLLGKHIDGQLYTVELSPELVTKITIYEIDKILRTRLNDGILEYLVRWRGHCPEFDSWIKASSLMHVKRSEPLLRDSV